MHGIILSGAQAAAVGYAVTCRQKNPKKNWPCQAHALRTSPTTTVTLSVVPLLSASPTSASAAACAKLSAASPVARA